MRKLLCLAALLFAAPAHAVSFGESAIRPAAKQAAITALTAAKSAFDSANAR